MSKDYTQMFVEQDGSVYNTMSNCIVENPAILTDVSDGIVFKLGDVSLCKVYMPKLINSVKLSGGDTSGITLIKFDKYGSLSTTDICTFMNYSKNSIGGEKMRELLSMPEQALKEKLKKLHEIGF